MKIDKNRYGTLLGYVDICMNLLMCFIALFVFSMLLIKLEQVATPKDAKIESKGKILVHMTWDDKSFSDIDLWVKTDNPEEVVGFKKKDAPNMFLDNDNLGLRSHTVILMNGSSVTTYGNAENIIIKNCTQTRVTVNLHLYSAIEDKPVNAHVEVTLIDPYITVVSKDIVLDRSGREITAVNFDLDEGCGIKNINTEQIPFVYNHVDIKPSVQGDK